MELIGTIQRINDKQTFDSGFQKQDAVILTEEQYPQPILIEFLSDKTELLNAVKIGDKVKIGINLRGREWTNPQGEVRYFNSITAWRLDKEEAHIPKPSSGGDKAHINPADVFGNDEDDLPF